jgi:GT2 family glycosyltransferase
MSQDNSSYLLSIGIVTFNSEKAIRQTLESILSNIPVNLPTQIIIRDNRSIDATNFVLSPCVHKYPNLNYNRNKTNLGFARAHNQILTTADSRYHAICNPDVFIAKDIFTPLIDFMEAHPQIGVCCPKFLNTDESVQFLNRRMPNILDLFLRRFLPTNFKFFFKKRLYSYEMRDIGYDKSYDVPFVSGAFMFCRTHVLKEISGFDERFFLYFEDADLSRRVQSHGYRTVYFPDVSVIHLWERLAHKNLMGSWIFIKSAYRYFRKWGWTWW